MQNLSLFLNINFPISTPLFPLSLPTHSKHTHVQCGKILLTSSSPSTVSYAFRRRSRRVIETHILFTHVIINLRILCLLSLRSVAIGRRAENRQQRPLTGNPQAGNFFPPERTHTCSKGQRFSKKADIFSEGFQHFCFPPC